MRWLEKVYRKVSDKFRDELAKKHGLNSAEIKICEEIAAEDAAQSVKMNSATFGSRKPEGDVG